MSLRIPTVQPSPSFAAYPFHSQYSHSPGSQRFPPFAPFSLQKIILPSNIQPFPFIRPKHRLFFRRCIHCPLPPPFPAYKNRRQPFSLSGFCPPPLTGYTISQFSVYGCFRLSPCVSSFQKPRFSHSKNRERPRFPHVRSLLLFSQISINSRNSRIMPIPSG